MLTMISAICSEKLTLDAVWRMGKGRIRWKPGRLFMSFSYQSRNGEVYKCECSFQGFGDFGDMIWGKRVTP